MSKGFNITKVCDNKIVYDDHIVENDFKTVIVNAPFKSTNVVVRVNDFIRRQDFKNETFIREDISTQVDGTRNTFIVSKGPVFNGLKLGQISTRNEDVVVKVYVENEIVQQGSTGQFTGTENFFYTQAKPLLRRNEYDFSTYVTLSNSLDQADIIRDSDVIVKINNVAQNNLQISNIDSNLGRIQLTNAPLTTDMITITYCYKAKIKSLDAIQSSVTLKQIPLLGQKVKIGYYSSQSDGWYLTNTSRSLVPKAKDVVFYNRKNTDRFYIDKETVSQTKFIDNQTFTTIYSPILPLYETFNSTVQNTLNNAVVVYLNNTIVPVSAIDPKIGKIKLFQKIQKNDIVQVSYYYKTDIQPDRISLDYYVDPLYCDKCTDLTDFVDYTIDPMGNYQYIENEAKLEQDLKKIIVTVIGSDKVATWFGTDFTKIIGKKQILSIQKTKIAGEITTALSKLKSAQVQQQNYQVVTDAEFLNSISSMSIQQSASDPTLYTVDVGVVTQSGASVTAQQPISG